MDMQPFHALLVNKQCLWHALLTPLVGPIMPRRMQSLHHNWVVREGAVAHRPALPRLGDQRRDNSEYTCGPKASLKCTTSICAPCIPGWLYSNIHSPTLRNPANVGLGCLITLLQHLRKAVQWGKQKYLQECRLQPHLMAFPLFWSWHAGAVVSAVAGPAAEQDWSELLLGQVDASGWFRMDCVAG